MKKCRLLFYKLIEYIEDKKTEPVALIAGLRRTGKTTLLYQLQEYYEQESIYIDAAQSHDVIDTIGNAMADEKISLILIDEISQLDDYEVLCQGFFNMAMDSSTPKKIILTGSSPSHIISLSNSKLGCRSELFRLPLLTLIEYLYYSTVG
jgi:predicted AAA+ superfamily ATPase